MPPTVFISYSHKDKVWKDRLLTHLGVLEEGGLLQTWSDQKIRAGDEWFGEIREAMDIAKVAVLLVSANSLTSKFILNQEVSRLLERRAQDGVVIFPVIVKDCAWQKVSWLAKLQVRPPEGKPLALRGIRIDSELKAIAEEILELVQNGAQPSAPQKPTVGAISSTLPSLHQLPAPPADFTGREEDLEALRSTLTQGGTGAIFGLRGLGGVGKTTLALKLAEELTPRYPDAQLYLDLKGVDPQPLTAAQAMTHGIRSFHPEAQLPEDGTALTGLYRSVLFGKSALLLMDNAAIREQVEPLIPPTGSLLLVTSRFHFTLPGLVARDLDEMSKEDARELLLKMAPRIGNESDEIARICGWLPLALRLAGSTLAERLDLYPSEYASRLREGKERLGPMEASLNLSYELLKPEQQRLWRMLAVFPGTFDGKAAAAVWELEIDLAKEALWELVKCSLVEWEKKEERYRLHDLAREFTERGIETVERDAAQSRHAEHFLEILRTANELYLKGGEAVLLALRLFDVEWSNIQSGYTWAASHFIENNEAARVCGAYPHAGVQLLSLRLRPRERIRWMETALAAARRLGDKAKEGAYLGNLGYAYMQLGEPRRAIEFSEQRLAIARDIDDRHGEGVALGSLGLAYNNLGELRRAIDFCEQHLANSRDIGDRRGEGAALNNLGLAYSDLGEPRRAIEFYEQALASARDIGYRRGESTALGNLGLAYADLGEPRRAIEFYEQSLAIARDIGDRYREGAVLGNLGFAYADLGEPRRALEFYEQQLTIARETDNRPGEAKARWNLGLVYEKEGDLARAADLMQVWVDFEREIGHPDAEKDAAYVQAIRARIAGQNS